jgi:F-type H+-transporting ATPase subunit b
VRIPLVVFWVVASAVAAVASGEPAAGHGTSVPWWEIFKQAVNFAILAGVLVYFLKKPLSSYLKERSELLRRSIEEAAKARADATEKLSAVEARMGRLAGEVEELSRRMDADSDAEAQRIRDAGRAEVERVHAQARFTADQEVRKAREELRREAAELGTRAAEEIVKKTMTPADQERLVRENIDKIGEIVQ